MAKVFVLEGENKGKTVQLMGRYNFVNGVMLEESDDDAKLKAAVLCGFYPCKMMDFEAYQKSTAEAKPADKSAAQPSPQAHPAQPAKA